MWVENVIDTIILIILLMHSLPYLLTKDDV
jgi:hypothetical protein